MTAAVLHPQIADLTIRRITQADLTALEWGGEYTHFRRLYHEIFQTTLKGKAVMWAADLRPKGIIGQVFVQYSSARTELADGASRGYLFSFRVQPAYRGYGIGASLLKTAEGDLARRGFQWATLNVARDNPAGRRFYERHGYHVIAEEPGCWHYLDDQGVRRDVVEPAWRMQKHLNKPG